MVEREGFEPSKAMPADLQSAPFGHFGISPQYFVTFSLKTNKSKKSQSIKKMELARGLEPPTAGLQNRCSTN